MGSHWCSSGEENRTFTFFNLKELRLLSSEDWLVGKFRAVGTTISWFSQLFHGTPGLYFHSLLISEGSFSGCYSNVVGNCHHALAVCKGSCRHHWCVWRELCFELFVSLCRFATGGKTNFLEEAEGSEIKCWSKQKNVGNFTFRWQAYTNISIFLMSMVCISDIR